MSDIKELTNTLLDIRNELFSGIPEEFVSQIITIQDRYAQDRSEAYKQIISIP